MAQRNRKRYGGVLSVCEQQGHILGEVAAPNRPTMVPGRFSKLMRDILLPKHRIQSPRALNDPIIAPTTDPEQLEITRSMRKSLSQDWLRVSQRRTHATN